MSEISRYYEQFPPAKPWRRVVATGVDFVTAWLLSVVAAVPEAAIQWGQILVFLGVWWGLRAAVGFRNKGQSLGHWLMNSRIIDARGRTPTLQTLTQREAILGGLLLLALVAVTSGLGVTILLLLAPVVVDVGWAWMDERHRTLHDLVARTEVLATFRGFYLDRKLIKLSQHIRQQRASRPGDDG